MATLPYRGAMLSGAHRRVDRRRTPNSPIATYKQVSKPSEPLTMDYFRVIIAHLVGAALVSAAAGPEHGAGLEAIGQVLRQRDDPAALDAALGGQRLVWSVLRNIAILKAGHSIR